MAPDAGPRVIKVKSHPSVARSSDGTWRLGQDPPTVRGSFRQVQEAMHSIRHYLLGKRVELRDILVLHAVWFTGVHARAMLPDAPEWHSLQVLVSSALPTIAQAVGRVMRKGAQHLASMIKYFGFGGYGPDRARAERIVTTPRPRFEVVTTAGDRRQVREGQLAQLVEGQYHAVDSAADNRGVLFTGSNGTGKDSLVVESAQREIAQGRTGRLLCFSRLLGCSLRERLSDVAGLRVGTLRQEMLRLAGISGPPTDPDGDFWEGELPGLTLEGLAEQSAEQVGEFLIIDETQDLTIDAYLDLLDLLVKGGMRNGRVLMFGDFERQAVYGSESSPETLRARAPHLASSGLSESRRNFPRTRYQVNISARIESASREFRRRDDGVDPTIVRYTCGDDQSLLLRESVRAMRDEGFGFYEAVALSPLSNRAAVATMTEPWLRQVLVPDYGFPLVRGKSCYAMIHSRKRLNAPAITATDIDDSGVPSFEAFIYIGLARATDRLTVLEETKTLRQLVGGPI